MKKSRELVSKSEAELRVLHKVYSQRYGEARLNTETKYTTAVRKRLIDVKWEFAERLYNSNQRNG